MSQQSAFSPQKNNLAIAEVLFDQWEKTLLSRISLDTAEFRSLFIQCIGQMLDHDTGTNLDWEDVRHVLHGATCLSIGQAEASGPSRAIDILTKAYDNEIIVGNRAASAGRMLLSVVSHPKAELSMDELTSILENLQQQVGPESEIVFGHDTDPLLKAELRLLYIRAIDTGG